MELPVRTVRPLAILAGHENGRLPASILIVTPPAVAGAPVVTMLAGAPTRAWLALQGRARQAGITLTITSTADSYRSYQVQEILFRTRYTTTYIPDRPWKMWDGNGRLQRWYQKPNTAVAAVPGTSNHGLAIADDIANASGRRLDWMLDNCLDFGFSWETQSEPWHIRYFHGDTLPAAVLAYEEEQDMPTTKEIADAVWGKTITDTGLTAQTIMLRAMLAAQAAQAGVAAANAKLDALAAGDGAPIDVALILAGVKAQLDLAVADITAVTETVGVEARDAVADGLEGGSAKVREDAD